MHSLYLLTYSIYVTYIAEAEKLRTVCHNHASATFLLYYNYTYGTTSTL